MESYLSLRHYFSLWGAHCPLGGVWEPAGAPLRFRVAKLAFSNGWVGKDAKCPARHGTVLPNELWCVLYDFWEICHMQIRLIGYNLS